MPVTRIGTRGSKLALWQARYAKQQLALKHPGLEIEIVPITTEGDRRLDLSISEFGGKGVFIKELERALLDDRIDLAVHSMKDVTVHLDSHFCIPAILERANPFDAFVSNQYPSIDYLPVGAVVGTCSLRRQCQIKKSRPDLKFKVIRGNVQTRLKKLDNGEYDAIILAVAGLERLSLDDRISHVMKGFPFIPSPGQGAIGIECKSDDVESRRLIGSINHKPSFIEVSAERVANLMLGGSCHVPIGIHAQIKKDELLIQAAVGAPDDQDFITAISIGELQDYQKLAQQLANELLKRGAKEILDEFG